LNGLNTFIARNMKSASQPTVNLTIRVVTSVFFNIISGLFEEGARWQQPRQVGARRPFRVAEGNTL
jgi:hypothetical protein